MDCSDREGYNRTWLDRKQDVRPDVALSSIPRSAQDKSLKLPPGIPDWLYWTLSLGALLVLQARYSATHAMEKRDQLAPMAVLVLLLILVMGFTIWPSPPVFLGVAAVGLFMQILYTLPQITNEGLRALHRQLRPTIDGPQQPETQQKPQDELDRPGTVSFWSQISVAG